MPLHKPLLLEPLPGESPVRALPLPSRWHSFRFGFVVTAGAIYLPVPKRHIALYEPLEPRRIPLEDIRRVVLSKAPPVTARHLFFGPFFLFFALMSWLLAADGGDSWHLVAVATFLYGIPLLRAVLGAAGRFRLTVETSEEAFSFLPTADDAVARSTKDSILRAQLSFLEAARSVGLTVIGPDGPSQLGPA